MNRKLLRSVREYKRESFLTNMIYRRMSPAVFLFFLVLLMFRSRSGPSPVFNTYFHNNFGNLLR